MKYVFLVSYDGTHFSGWQRQSNARTVQSVLEEAAVAVFGSPTKIRGSGRTDAGVHAEGQVCECEGDTSIPARKLRECFNRLLPADVSVLESASAPEGFDCTRSPKKKTYVYRAYFAPCPLPLYERYEARLGAKADAGRMRSAAEHLLGEHDFKAFSATGSSAKTSVRTVDSVTVRERAEDCAAHYEIEVCGNGFLYNMVRIIAGELFAIGCGKSEEFLLRALQTGERALLAGTMPPQGLTLLKTIYQTPLFGEQQGGGHGIF